MTNVTPSTTVTEYLRRAMRVIEQYRPWNHAGDEVLAHLHDAWTRANGTWVATDPNCRVVRDLYELACRTQSFVGLRERITALLQTSRDIESSTGLRVWYATVLNDGLDVCAASVCSSADHARRWCANEIARRMTEHMDTMRSGPLPTNMTWQPSARGVVAEEEATHEVDRGYDYTARIAPCVIDDFQEGDDQ